jgi:hypothetical protein
LKGAALRTGSAAKYVALRLSFRHRSVRRWQEKSHTGESPGSHSLFQEYQAESAARTNVQTEQGRNYSDRGQTVYNVDTDKSDSGTELGFSFRRLALILLILLAFRGAMGGIREFVVNGNWLAGILGVIVVSVIAYWLFNLYVGSHSEA